MVRFWAAVVTALLVGGCSTTKIVDGTCLAMSPHFPEVVRRTDHSETKASAYYRNVAFRGACPEYMPASRRSRR